MSTPTVLPPAALAGLAVPPRAGSLIRAGLARAVLFTVPLALAVATREPFWVAGSLPVLAVAGGWIPPHRPGRAGPLGSALLGLSQGAAVLLAWRLGPDAPAVPPIAALPLAALPLAELLAGWHLARLAAGLRYDDRLRHQRYLRRVGWATVVVLLMPLLGGAALAGMAARLPVGLSGHPEARALLLALAAGALLAGVVAIGRLIAARGRAVLAALVTTGPPLAGVALEGLWFAGWVPAGPIIPLAIGYAAGLVLAAYVLSEGRSLP